MIPMKPNTEKAAERIVSRAVELAIAKYHVSLSEAKPYQLHEALSGAVMESISLRWTEDQRRQQAGRFCAYISAEFLIGRAIYNNLYAAGILNETKALLAEQGADIACLEDIEDAALGNGGLGRLAACFLDSAATCNIPLTGYGLRYQYGLFKQEFVDCRQHEIPDDWTKYGDPWSIRRDELSVIVPMKGMAVKAVPYDMPVIGYGKGSCIGTLRLWQTESLKPIDFELFNEQQYLKAAAGKNGAEDIVKLLYPNDSKKEGKQLRVRQQFVMCYATLWDLLRNFEKHHGADYSLFPQFNAVQLNDTHPTMSIPLLIMLLQERGVSFEQAFEIAKAAFAYTNHTVMAEALEKWDLSLLGSVSPEMCAVIRKLAAMQKAQLRKLHVTEGLERMLLLQGSTVHMAYLAMFGGHAVNGVAKIHTGILQDDVLKEWYDLYPEMFSNKTNGITPRRWLGLCNPELCALLEKKIGTGFIKNADQLKKLRACIDDDLARDFIEVKKEKKHQLAEYIRAREGVDIPEHFVFDVQVKRLHEYKRQLLNALSILAIYYGIKDGSIRDLPPVAFIFGAKSAPGYVRAKSVIYFINSIADIINNDPDMKDRMRVVFVQNYNCSYAEKIIPAAEISEQISPAGTEASGTGNMKLMLNGAVTLGTFDGANIEIVQQSGRENNYIFGATLEEIEKAKPGYSSEKLYKKNKTLKRAVDALVDGTVADETGGLKELYDSLLKGASWHKPDHYFLFLDFDSYLKTKLQAIRDTADEIAFAKKCLYCVAGAGPFSSDRTVKEYAKEIWKI